MYSAYNIKANAKAREIAARFKNLEIDEATQHTGPVPTYQNDYPQRVSLDKNVQQSNGPTEIIDVQPDFRNVIQYINYYVTKLYSKSDVKPHPFMTPPAMAGYCLFLVYAQALLNDDDNVRDKQSDYARDFDSTYSLNDAKTDIRNLSVPPFMVPLLKGLATSIDERRPNIRFVYDLATFDLEYDFGRTPPVSLFFTAHNILASEAANQRPEAIHRKWYNTVLIEEPHYLTVANYLNIGEAQHRPNWFSNMCTSLFNPVTMRYNSVRPTFSTIEFDAQNFTETADTVNPYIHLMLLDSINLRSTIRAVNNMSTSFEELFEAKQKLGTIEHDEKGNQLISHYYQHAQLPTFTWHPVTVPEEQQSWKLDQQVKAIGFLNPVEDKPASKLNEVVATSFIPKEIYLTQGEHYDPTKDPDKFKTFNDQTDILDSVRHLSPYETKREELFFNIIHGKVIETEEIDSVCIPQPNPHNTIQIENAYFLESAIPFSQILPQHGRNVNVIRRVPHQVRFPAVRMNLYNRSQDIIPVYQNRCVNIDLAPLIGFDVTPHIPDVTRSCNTVSFEISTEETATKFDGKFRKIYAWSSYRYLNPKQNETVPIRNRRLMFTNMRSLFGTNSTLVETAHPANIIPQT